MSGRHFVIHTDGGARGNPGPAAIGAVIAEGGRTIGTISLAIGQATNNQAEYQAVHTALTWARDHQASRVDCWLDSQLVVEQLNGAYKIKNKDLGAWWLKIQSLVNAIGLVTFSYLPREQNAAADRLVNKALDSVA